MLDQLHTMMKTPIIYSTLCFLALLSAGCSSSSSLRHNGERGQETSKDGNRSLADYEATLDPADYDQEIEVIEKINIEEAKQKSSLEIPKDSLVIEEEVVQGFRIQIFSSSGVDEATFMKGYSNSEICRRFSICSVRCTCVQSTCGRFFKSL